jgi:hypothetical protein
MDNSNTAKEGVGRIDAGVDGFCPLAAYLGTQGDCLQLALRPGTQHSAFETPYDLEHLLPLAQRLCAAHLLVRADSGFCGEPILASVAEQARALTERTPSTSTATPCWSRTTCSMAGPPACRPTLRQHR